MANRKNVLRMDAASLRPEPPANEASMQFEPAPEDWIFALDIGTRTVIGVVGVARGERYEVLAASVLSHSRRAMMDGQIHDIAKVSDGVRSVKEALETKLGKRLHKVAIAAAGRVLRTCQVHVDRDVEEAREIDQDLVGALEMEGIRLAQDQLAATYQEEARQPFHCVGYSVIRYFLDDDSISNLLGHKGVRIGLDLLATFLPHVVVDSLHTVMERVGLQVTGMTLEPIAALNLAIPQDLRLLNLALVDVGAGTSDIAVTKGGTVIGYAMAPVAGDEVTEAIAQRWLVDFNTAEQIKLAAGNGQQEIAFTDILDNKMMVNAETIAETIQPVVDLLSRTIADQILNCNGGRYPNAVFLVGGGSQTPGLAGALSDLMGLPKERVAVRNRSIAKNVDFESELLQGPECITPLGILVTASQQAGRDFFHVHVGDHRVRLYNARRMTVADALLLAGYVPDQLIGKSGKALRFQLNGLDKVVRGGYGKPAEITRNGEPSGLTASVAPGDRILVENAIQGIDATSLAGDHVTVSQPVVLTMGQTRYEIPSLLLCNGDAISPDTPLHEGDSLVVTPPATLAAIAKEMELDPALFHFSRDGQAMALSEVPLPGDVILCEPIRQKVAEAVAKKPEHDKPVKALEQDGQLSGARGARQIYLTVNGESVVIPDTGKSLMFVDVFAHIRFDLTNPKGVIVLRLNGKDAGYTDPIRTGDDIAIYWRE